MSISRKENGSLVKKAGKALVDLAFSLTSNKAVANRVVSEGMALRNVTLYNGKLYQLNLDGTRGDEIEVSAVKRVLRGNKTIGNTTYTAPVTIAIPLGTTVVPSKCKVTLYGNTSTSGDYAFTCGFYVDSLTSSTLTLGLALNNLVPHPNAIIGWEIVEYN